MQQYFVDASLCVNQEVEMNKEQAHHIGNVMRMKQGEIIRLADYDEHMFFAHVNFKNNKVYAIIDEPIEDHTKTAIDITLAQGLIKKEKWDFLLQKCAELGVSRIVPFTSSRTVVKAKDEKQDKKLQRWNKILQEGCEQCKRSSLVTLDAPTTFVSLLEKSKDYDLKLIAYENADIKSTALKDVLRNHKTISNVFVVCGCEGGFSDEEVQKLEAEGFLRISLGARILRAETAAMSLVNQISFFYEMVGDGHDESC